MANIDSIIAFSQGKQRFGFMKNDYFLVSGHMYYKGMEWPIAAWTENDEATPENGADEYIAYVNTERRGNNHTIPQYVLDELNRLGVTTKTCTLREIKEIIDG